MGAPFSARALLFDLDGTLADTAGDLHAAASAMLQDLSLPPVSLETARGYIGDGMPRLIKRLITSQWWGEPDTALFDRASELLHQHYLCACARSPLYEGTTPVLSELQRRGLALGCVTNKNTAYTLPLLDARDIARFFSVVVCGDTLPRKKPDPAPLAYAMRALGVAPAATIMVGDSIADARAASAAHCRFICMTYGYHQTPPDSDAAANHFSEILELI